MAERRELTPRRARARATAPRPRPLPRRGGRMSGVTTKPAGPSLAAGARTRPTRASSSGRSTWQETTAYRSAPARCASSQRHRTRRSRRRGARRGAAAPRRARSSSAATILTAYTEKSDDFAQTFVAQRDVRVRPGHPVRVHAAALRLLPDPALLDLRPHWLGRRARADRGRGRDRAPRYAIARRVAAAARRRWSRARRDAQPVPDLARRPRQPRDPRPGRAGARSCSLTLVARAQRRSLLAAAALGALRGRRDPRQHAARRAAARARRVPRLAAAATAGACCRPRSSSSRRRVVVAPWLIRNDVSGRLLRDHDRRARALEGEQRQHATTRSRTASGSTTCRNRRLPADARRTSRAIWTATTGRSRTSTSARRCATSSTRPSTSGAPPGREGEAAGAGDAAALGPARARDAGPARQGHVARRRAPRRRAGLDRSRSTLLALAGLFLVRRSVRGARGALARLQHPARRWSSRARRATACRSTSCSCCSRRRRSSACEQVAVHRLDAVGGGARARTDRARADAPLRRTRRTRSGSRASSTIARGERVHVLRRHDDAGLAVARRSRAGRRRR